MATPSSGQRTVPPQEMTQLIGSGVPGGAIGQAVSGCSFCAEEGDAGQVAPVSSSSLGGGPGQEASDTSSPVASSSRLVPASPSGVGSGQVASELSPMVVASPVRGGELGRAALVLPPPSSLTAPSCGARQASRPPTGAAVGKPMQVARTAGWGEAGGRTPSAISREEVIAFGGIQDPMSEGRWVSDRLQAHPDVDDIQQRCAMRAAKLRDVAVTTGMSVNTSNSILHFQMMRLLIMQIN